MTYDSKQDLIDRFEERELVQLTDRGEESTGAINDTMVTTALVEADAEINSYLAKQVATPITPVPAHVNRIACDIARFRLYRDHVPDHVKDAYKAAVAWLTRAANGDVALGDSAAPTAKPSSGVVQVSAPDRVFTREKLKGF